MENIDAKSGSQKTAQYSKRSQQASYIANRIDATPEISGCKISPGDKYS
jgi:hypothetical protein